MKFIINVIWCAIVFCIASFTISSITIKIFCVITFCFPMLLFSIIGFNHENILYVIFYMIKYFSSQKIYLYK